MKHPASAVGLCVLLSNLGAAFDLDGSWNIASLCVPSELMPQLNGSGQLTDLQGTDNFDAFIGRITVTGSTFTGNFDGPTSGTIAVDPSGVVTTTDLDLEVFSYFINSSSDFLVGQLTSGPYQELQLLVKEPVTTTLDDVVGDWNLVGLCVPAGLPKTFTGGILTGLDRGDNFEVFKASLSVAENGSYLGNTPGEGGFMGSLAVLGPGMLRATDTGPDPEPPFDLFLNQSKDLMIAAVAESDFNELLIFVKSSGSGEQHDLQGRWPLVSYNTPSSVSLQLNGSGQAIGVNNGMSFEAGTGQFTLDPSGRATGQFDPDEELSGQITLDSPGAITAAFEGDPPFPGFVNLNKNILITSDSDSDYNELLVAVRNSTPFGLASAAIAESDGVSITWVGAPNRRLQELATTEPPTWSDVDGTQGQSSATLPLGTGPHLFRVAED